MTINILLKPYQTSWQSDYEHWLYELSQVLDFEQTDQFEHFGSTAIPNIIAKPTIDIMLGVDDIKIFHRSNEKHLLGLGFDYVASLETTFPFRRYYQLLDEEQNHLVHLHVVVKDGYFWQRHLLFQKYLLKHQSKVDAYSKVKQYALEHATTCDEYNALKTEFIYDCMREAFVDVGINSNYSKHENWIAAQPQNYSKDIIEQLYEDRTLLEKDLNHWDQHGFGPFWWFDKTTKQWVARAGWTKSDLGEGRRKWIGPAQFQTLLA